MSMGGHGALQLALNSPGTFSVVGAHSVALRTYEEALPMFGDRVHFSAHDPSVLLLDKNSLTKQFDIWLDIGTSDRWFAAAQSLHEKLANQNIRHEWHAFGGGHDAAYWKAHSADYLRFYGRSIESRSGSARMSSP